MLYVVLWATGFIPSRVLVADVTPLWAAVLRLTLAGSLLVLYALMQRLPLPTRREWRWITAIGIAINCVYLGLLYVALRHLSSGMAAIIASTNPLMLALVAPAFLREKLGRRTVAGLVLGFAGVLAIMGLRAGSALERVPDELIAVVSVTGLVASTVLFKRACFTVSLLVVTGWQLLIGGSLLVPLAFGLEGWPRIALHASSLMALAYLVIVMSIGASLLWFWLLERGDASRLSAYYYVTPILGLLFSHFTLGEPLQLSDLIGVVAVAAGIAAVQRGGGSSRPQPIKDSPRR